MMKCSVARKDVLFAAVLIALAAPMTASCQQAGTTTNIERIDVGAAAVEASLKDTATLIRKMLADYPSAAIRDGLQGRVGVKVMVGVEGRVTACEVVQSSGHAVLDRAACHVMMRYAKFNPARDASGRAIPGQFSTVLTYAMP